MDKTIILQEIFNCMGESFAQQGYLPNKNMDRYTKKSGLYEFTIVFQINQTNSGSGYYHRVTLEAYNKEVSNSIKMCFKKVYESCGKGYTPMGKVPFSVLTDMKQLPKIYRLPQTKMHFAVLSDLTQIQHLQMSTKLYWHYLSFGLQVS